MLQWIADPNAWAALVTLTAMEIVLGIDNVVFISVLVSRLRGQNAKRVRAIGLLLAFVFRVIMLLALSSLIALTAPVVNLFGKGLSWRDLILVAGGLFLVWKATTELHQDVEGRDDTAAQTRKAPQSVMAAIIQIAIVDLVFSIDSIVTAIGMAEHVEIMIAAVVISMGIMYLASGAVADFIKRNPTTKVLALAFLVLIGVSLTADGWGFHIPRGYIYFAMAFSAGVEFVNIRARRKRRAG